MSSELIINSTQAGYRIGLLKEKNLIEFHHDRNEDKFTVGDIYLGTVRKVVPGLNAAFIDVGYQKDAFLHYLDLGPKIKTLNKFTKIIQTRKKGTIPTVPKFRIDPDIDKFGKINQVLTRNQQILVQIVKEPISTKGPRLSSELSIAGRYLILVPFSSIVSISKRITSSIERKRLTRLLNAIKPDNFGVIIRTLAEGVEVAKLDADLRGLVERWESGMQKLKTAKPRSKVVGEMNRASSLLRDVLNESFDNIVIDDKVMYQEVKTYIKSIAPEKENIVRMYQGKTKIFEHYGIEKQLKTLFGKSVSVKGGGYLIIEHTEAMHVIDVNSGNKSNAEKDQEATALNVNMKAAEEVARQIILRDIGGIIVIDFIDMRKVENKKKLFAMMKDAMKDDRSKYTILPLSKFGLMQITRQRVRPELTISTGEACPSCAGTGKIQATIQIADMIENQLSYLLTTQSDQGITLVLHPYIEAFFTKGMISKRIDWFFKFKKWINLEADNSLSLNEFHFMNKMGTEIEINEEDLVS